MDINEAIEELKNVGDFLNYNLGSESYEVRCKIYDIRTLLIEQVKNSVVLVQSEQLVCPRCKSDNTNKHLSNFNTCYDCDYRWVN
jgi:transposase-like protein